MEKLTKVQMVANEEERKNGNETNKQINVTKCRALKHGIL